MAGFLLVKKLVKSSRCSLTHRPTDKQTSQTDKKTLALYKFDFMFMLKVKDPT